MNLLEIYGIMIIIIIHILAHILRKKKNEIGNHKLICGLVLKE